jgi:hypothetical protein
MTPFDEGADRVGHGEAGLGEAQSANPPDDREMIADDAPPLDAECEGEERPPEEPPRQRGSGAERAMRRPSR